MPGLTPSQTVGPFFHIGLDRLFHNDLVPEHFNGAPVTFTGQVLDADGEPVPDAVLELWQADHLGRYWHPSHPSSSEPEQQFPGWGRVPTDDRGHFEFRTIQPGRVAGPKGTTQAPHINVTIFMRGLLRHLFTRVYFDGDSANATDPVLLSVPEPRRYTLIAKRSDADHYTWNVMLQGAHETVFFDW
jgi:protocatechuate 3,4-dioxygenase, alpha subunit